MILPRISFGMNSKKSLGIGAVRFILLSAIGFAGCTTARNVAVTSFRVLDTPARFVRDRIDPPQTTITTTTTESARTSDVTTPGHPIAAATPSNSPSPHHAEVQRREIARTQPAASGRSESNTTVVQRKATPSATPRVTTTAQAPQFPTARPVPGKPGYVYSVDPKGGIVDVTGYKPGDRAKDPYTQQIFIVP